MRTPFRIATTASLFSLVLVGACGDFTPPELSDGDEPSSTSSEPGALSERSRSHRTEYTSAELAALAQSPAVKVLNMTFEAAPPPTRSQYVTVSDGTRLAVSLYFPADFDEATDKAPVIYVETWYGRAVEATATAIDLYRAAGFVVAIVDPRGFGASFGWQTAFLTSDVRSDQEELIAWFASQPWSNGQVAGAGHSISATHAEAMAASGAPAFKAAIIRASDFDLYQGDLFPGGIPNTAMLGLVEQVTEWMRGEPCLFDLNVCPMMGIAPVDGDTDFRLLQAAFLDHQKNLRGGELASLTYRDEQLGSGRFDDMSAVGSINQLREAAVPARVSASWLDGTTAEGALARFKALPNVPMEVVIGATAHSGGLNADPFSRTPFGAARPPALEQYAGDVNFVQRVLAGETIGRSISYVMLGSGVWKTTEQWPPAGVTSRTLMLSRDDLVSGGRVKPGQRSYQVDVKTSSGGPFNRWGSQGGGPVYYGDRRDAPGRRLTFDTAPVSRNAELIGAPELCLAMRSNRADGTVFAYLEDVSPSGRVTHLTEGQLRLHHRKTRTGGCDRAPGTERSFNRADGAPVTPGELMYVEVPLLPTAAVIEKGHRVRLSIAGADAGTFPAVTETPGTWVVSYGGTAGSTLTLPVKGWSP